MLAATNLPGCGSDPGFNENTDFAVDDGSAQFVNLMGDSPSLTILHGLSRTSVQFPFTSPIELRAADEYDWEIVYLNDPNEFNSDNQIVVAEGRDQLIKKDSLSTFLLHVQTYVQNLNLTFYLSRKYRLKKILFLSLK